MLKDAQSGQLGLAGAAADTSGAAELYDTGRLNQDLARQINELLNGEHMRSECWASGRPLVIEGLLWIAFGGAIWAASLYLAG